MKHIKFAAAAALVLALGLSGCAPAEDTPAEVKKETPTATDTDSIVVEEEEEEPEAPEIATLGDTMVLGDWEVKVTKVVKNANEAVTRANQFNEKPKGVYVLVTYNATYTGSERTADTLADLTWTLTTNDNQIHQQAAQVTPADNEEWPTEARKGGTVKGQVLFDVKPRLIKGGILTVETYDENFDTVFADFRV